MLWFLVSFGVLFGVSASKSLLKCNANATRIDDILQSLEDMGYNISKGVMTGHANVSNLAPQMNGIYATTMRSNSEQEDVPTYKMGAESAILFHGCTPPKSQYFGFTTMVYTLPAFVWAETSNPINNENIKTYQQTTFDDLATIVTTADKQTLDDIITAYEDNGVSDINDLMNVNYIPSKLVNMGLSNNATSFQNLMRTALSNDSDALLEYANAVYSNDPHYVNVYFISTNNEEHQSNARDPIVAQNMTSRMCNDSDFGEFGNNEHFLDDTTNRIINNITNTIIQYKYKDNGKYKMKKMWELEGGEYDGLDCIRQSELCLGLTSDALYYESFNIDDDDDDEMGHVLKDEDVYIIIGVNHYNLGFTVYNQETIYNYDYASFKNSDANLNNFQYNDSARMFVSEGDRNYSHLYYAIMYARPGKCIDDFVENGVICVELDYDDLKKNDGFIVFSRAYLNPCTETGPSTNQLQSEYLIRFRAPSNSSSTLETWEWFLIGIGALLGIGLIMALFYYFCCKNNEEMELVSDSDIQENQNILYNQ